VTHGLRTATEPVPDGESERAAGAPNSWSAQMQGKRMRATVDDLAAGSARGRGVSSELVDVPVRRAEVLPRVAVGLDP
jgi:hypothetical protein